MDKSSIRSLNHQSGHSTALLVRKTTLILASDYQQPERSHTQRPGRFSTCLALVNDVIVIIDASPGH